MGSTLGIYRLRLLGPAPAVARFGNAEVEVRGENDDRIDRSNLHFHAVEALEALYDFVYDELPEEFTPFEFSEPELTANKYRNPDGTQQWFVGVYDVDRGYGGPEEGGWYFDAGTLVRQIAVSSYDEAERVRNELREEFPKTDRRYSVLGGADYDITIGIEPPRDMFPEQTPRYE